MKKLFALLLAFITLGSALAQAPEKFSYQAVIRDGNDILLTNHALGMKLSIMQGSINGDSVYVETQAATTNDNGLVSLQIGGGTPTRGNFSQIDWSDGPYFLKRDIDPAGGTNYTISGTSQLLSVPYALYSKKVEMYADGSYVLNYNWGGTPDTVNNSATIASTNANWKGNRKIMLNGYVTLEFDFPSSALTNGLSSGTANLDLLLKYNGQPIMPLNFKHIRVADNAQITLPLSALIPNSTAGNSMQFTVSGVSNHSFTDSYSNPGGSVGPFYIDVKMTVVFYWLEL